MFVDTYRADDIIPKIMSVRWEEFAGQTSLWQSLLRILRALDRKQPQLGTIRLGELTVEMAPTQERSDDSVKETWPMRFGQDGLDQLEQRYCETAQHIAYLVPFSVNLNLEAYLYLPSAAEGVRVLWYDSPDLMDLGLLPIKRAASSADPDHMSRWQSVSHSDEAEAGSDLYIRMMAELSEWAQYIVLHVCSSFDVWHPCRFDGTPNSPHGPYNFQHLQGLMQDLAAQTGGTLKAGRYV
jgi:hypothetical protein